MSAVKPNIKITKNSSSKSSTVDFKQLPSYQFRHVNWSDLKNMDITGPCLKGPRIRATPSLKDKEFDSVPESSANYQPHIYNFSSQQEKRAAIREVKEVQNIKNKIEDWENVSKVNLSYQELGGQFQRRMLNSTLRKLIRCETLILVDNRLSDLSDFTFPCVKELNLSLNVFESCSKLPVCPRLETLNLTGNKISTITDVSKLGSVRVLKLRNNPLVWTVADYRKLLYKMVPSLSSIDGVTRENFNSREGKLQADNQ
jgi:hypothetical protein